jgi:hypothetical protein
VSQTPTPKKAMATAGTTFDPLPGLNVPHLSETVITGNVPGTGPQCRVIGLINDHFVIPTFSVETGTGKFKIIVAGGLLWDNNLYVVSVWSDDPADSARAFLDTRPPG